MAKIKKLQKLEEDNLKAKKHDKEIEAIEFTPKNKSKKQSK